MMDKSVSWSNSKGTQFNGDRSEWTKGVVIQEIEPKVSFPVLQGLYTL